MTGYTRPEENTLGVLTGRRNRGGVPSASTAARAMRQASATGASLGTGHLGIGAGLIAAVQGLFGITLFVWHMGEYPSLLPIVVSWFVFIASLVGIGITLAARGERMSALLFGAFLIAQGCVVALDFVAIWPLHDIGRFATSSASVGFGLLVAVTLRSAREMIVATAVLGAAFVTAILMTTPLNSSTLPAQFGVLAMAVLPPIFGVYVVRRFRRLVQLELDRVLVQSTISAPRFAVGMLASEELARLDLAAEELLDSVATGKITLPLSPKTASTAASLATELRLHLIEGRRETWLYHAVTESEQLGKSVTLIDPGSLAGLLDPHQRDGLLSAVWLLVSDKGKTASTVQVTLGPIVATLDPVSHHTVPVPIVVVTTGVPRNRVDPATWNAIGKVGRFLDSTRNSSLRVEIECVVANPAEQ
ncbi:MAG: hypothetical protein JWM70_1106 [Microbacteriaceae bacterium]|nr:hypothetical protein [Microbacteriaceae bacterium]